jgi:predicted metal-dependent peptidase
MNGETAHERLLRARSALILSQPFYGTLALNLEPVECDKLPNGRPCETMATDSRRLFFNPGFVRSLSDSELAGVIAHEVCHVIYLHGTRRNGRDAKLWNVAGDYAINRDLAAGKIRLPASALIDSRFDGMTTDEIYAALNIEQQQSGGGKPGAGKGNGAPGAGAQAGDKAGAGADLGGDPGGCGEVLDAAPTYDGAASEASESDWQGKIRQAAAVAARAGKLPAGIAGLIEQLDRPKLDPAATFRRFIDESTSRDFSWSRPNRRYLDAGLIFPGYVPTRPAHIVAVVDTSGSTMGARGTFAGFLQAALDDGAADKLTVIYADTRVQETAEYEPGDVLDLKTRGDGGTAFREPLAWIGEHCPDASAIAYLTDCETSDWGDEPAAPVLWHVCGEPRAAKHHASGAPFGEALLLME